MKKLLGIIGISLLLASICWAGGSQNKKGTSGSSVDKLFNTDSSVISAQGAIGRTETTPSGPLFSGDGGMEIRLAILDPDAQGDVPPYLPLYIQGLLINNFRKYSAITLTDRQNLEKIKAEQNLAADGSYSDKDFITIGNLTNAQYFLFGVIQKLSGERYSLLLSVTGSGSGETKAYSVKSGTLAQLEGSGTIINEISADLLTQLGVTLTENGKRELLAGSASAVKAEAGLARGITAQAGGADVEALFNFSQAISFDPSQIEALTRLNLLSSSISGGSISERIVNDIQARNRWLDVFKEATIFYNDHPPFEITFDPNLVQIGKTDYTKNTANLGMRIALDPSEAGFAALNALLEGLEKTGKRDDWGFSGWPLLEITPRTPGTVVFNGKRSFSFRVEIELLNEENKTIAKNSITLNTETIRFSPGNKFVLQPAGVVDTVYFNNVKAIDLTPALTIVIVSVNGIPSRDLNASGYMKVGVGDLERRAATARQAQSQREAEEEARQAQAEREATARRAQLEREAATRRAQAEKEAAARQETQRQQMRASFLKLSENAKRNEWEIISLHYLWGEEVWGIGASSNFYWSLVPFTTIGVGGNLDYSNGADFFAISGNFSPSLGLVFPFIANTKLFANAVLKMGNFGKRQGLLTEWMTPGFDVGFLFAGKSFCVNIKYQGTWLDGFYTNSIGLGVGIK